MIILGIGGSVHDYSCCILVDGKIEVAIEEERLSHEKHSFGKRSHLMKCIDYCLNAVGKTMDEVDYIIGNDLFMLSSLQCRMDKLISINHHLAHCASSFYTSGMDDAACLVIDGMGSRYKDYRGESISLYRATREKGINLLEKVLCNATPFAGDTMNSIGNFYNVITKLCGFGDMQEGKTMGLSSYGKDTYVKDIEKFIAFDSHQGQLYFSFDYEGLTNFGARLLKDKNIQENFALYADVAYAGQALLESYVFQIMEYLYSLTGTQRLAYSGGVALNSVLNGKIKEYTHFSDVSIFPAANDAGTGVGAALYMYHNLLKYPYKEQYSLSSVFWGRTYTNDEIEACLQAYSGELVYTRCDDESLVMTAAEAISENKIIGWFQAGAEAGPRALGNRSILANPMDPQIKDTLNSRVKFRESFRPFAPSVLKEHMNEFFESDFPDNPFMLFVASVKESQKDRIPGVVHVDGTARLQTVSSENNLRYYQLISIFYQKTGIPMVVNTSFNIKGKPIVEKPADAVRAFLNCDMDELFLYNYHVTKIKGNK